MQKENLIAQRYIRKLKLNQSRLLYADASDSAYSANDVVKHSYDIFRHLIEELEATSYVILLIVDRSFDGVIMEYNPETRKIRIHPESSLDFTRKYLDDHKLQSVALVLETSIDHFEFISS